jgi:hypothetical protein
MLTSSEKWDHLEESIHGIHPEQARRSKWHPSDLYTYNEIYPLGPDSLDAPSNVGQSSTEVGVEAIMNFFWKIQEAFQMEVMSQI